VVSGWKIRNHQVFVTCAAEFVAASANSGVYVILMTNGEVQRRQVALDVKTLNQKKKKQLQMSLQNLYFKTLFNHYNLEKILDTFLDNLINNNRIFM
jgi:hypothetical protein